MTLVALTVATAGMPGARPSSSAASRVIAAVMRCGPALISTSAITPSTSIDWRVPARRLRADSGAPVLWRVAAARRRVISLAGTRRRLRSSRVVFRRPSRSQRRSVSTETLRARAASPMERSSAIVEHSIGLRRSDRHQRLRPEIQPDSVAGLQAERLDEMRRLLAGELAEPDDRARPVRRDRRPPALDPAVGLAADADQPRVDGELDRPLRGERQRHLQ